VWKFVSGQRLSLTECLQMLLYTQMGRTVVDTCRSGLQSNVPVCSESNASFNPKKLTHGISEVRSGGSEAMNTTLSEDL